VSHGRQYAAWRQDTIIVAFGAAQHITHIIHSGTSLETTTGAGFGVGCSTTSLSVS
jgi:hypothetical protein